MPWDGSRVIDGARSAVRTLGDAILPQTCVVCGHWIPSDGSQACAKCRATLVEVLRTSYCPRCGRSMRPESIHQDGCARCLHEPFWNVAEVARIGPYAAEPLSRLIVGLKYAGRERNARYLAELMGESLRQRAWINEVNALVPVPMHWFRRCQRPCDHATVFAEALSRRLEIPVHRAVRRLKYTPSQTRTASRRQRFENVRGCFGPARWYRFPRGVAGKTVCIVDNLISTGATICEVSKVLRKAGAKRIYAAVIARAVLPGGFQAQPVEKERTV